MLRRTTARESIVRVPGIAALLATTTLGFSGYSILVSVAPLWVVQGGADPAGAGLVNAILMLSTIVMQTTVPWALHRWGWTAVLVTGALLLGLPVLVFFFTDQLAWILAASAVRGAGFAVVTVCGSSAVSSLVGAERHGRAVGVYGLSIAVPQVLIMPASAWLAEAIDFRLVFALSVAAPVVAVPFALALGRRLDGLPRAASDHEAAHGGKRILLALIGPSLILLAVTTPGGALMSFAPQFPYPAFTVTIGLIALTGVAAVTRWLIGGLADAYGTRVFFPPLLATTAAGLGLCTWSVSEARPGTAVFLAGMMLAGVGYGSLQNLTLVTAFAAVPRRHHHTASAVWNMGFDAGTGLGSLVVGLVAAGAGFGAAVGMTAGFCVLGAAITLVTGLRARAIR